MRKKGEKKMGKKKASGGKKKKRKKGMKKEEGRHREEDRGRREGFSIASEFFSRLRERAVSSADAWADRRIMPVLYF